MADDAAPTREERRAKRDERRAKQRAANVGRAAKMHAARLAWERENGPAEAPRDEVGVHVGCSGWFYWHWRGVVYPDDLPTRDWFGHYTSRLKTVELSPGGGLVAWGGYGNAVLLCEVKTGRRLHSGGHDGHVGLVGFGAADATVRRGVAHLVKAQDDDGS